MDLCCCNLLVEQDLKSEKFENNGGSVNRGLTSLLYLGVTFHGTKSRMQYSRSKKETFLSSGIAVVICAFWAVYIVILFRFHCSPEFSLVILESITWLIKKIRISVVVHDFIFTPDTVTLVQTFSIRVCCENLFSDGPMSFSSNDSSNIVRARWRVRSWVQDPLGAYNLPIIYNKKSSPFGFCVCIYFPFSCVILFSLFFFGQYCYRLQLWRKMDAPKFGLSLLIINSSMQHMEQYAFFP